MAVVAHGVPTQAELEAHVLAEMELPEVMVAVMVVAEPMIILSLVEMEVTLEAVAAEVQQDRVALAE